MKRKRFCFLFLLACLLVFSLQGFTMTAHAAGQKKAANFKEAMAETSIRLLQETVKTSGKKNVLLSPDSILTALAMVENGAAGKTRSEMEKALGGLSTTAYTKEITGLNKRVSRQDALTYRVANSLWYRQGLISLKDSYMKTLTDTFGAQAFDESFDDGTVRKMNEWVSEKTEGKITNIIDRLDPMMRVVLMNAVYFKGAWADPYTSTVRRTFTNANGSKKKVPMLEGGERTYVKIAGADGFVKPYRGGQTAFLGLLPPKGMSVNTYLSKLTGAEWIRGYRAGKKKDATVRTRMPEFKYEFSLSLKKTLKKIGIKKAFASSANFSKMADEKVCIDDVLHKTYIDLNKDGTEAAAVTAVLMKASSVYMPEKIKQVYLDRPFVYAIIDVKTGVPLFIGAVQSL